MDTTASLEKMTHLLAHWVLTLPPLLFLQPISARAALQDFSVTRKEFQTTAPIPAQQVNTALREQVNQ